jgi:hypothetical protein
MPSLLHEITVTSVTPSLTEVYEGDLVNIIVIIKNNGNFTETFNVTAYANTTIIQTQAVYELNPATQITLTFNWNITGVSLGNYTIKAEANTVPEEINAADNVKIGGIVHVVPEFPSSILHLVIITTLLAVMVKTRKKNPNAKHIGLPNNRNSLPKS